jgi:hypothetical protein
MPFAFNSGIEVPSIDVIQSRDGPERRTPRATRDGALQAHLAGQEDRSAGPPGQVAGTTAVTQNDAI